MALDSPNSHFESPEERAHREGFEAAIKAFERGADQVLSLGIEDGAVQFRNGVYQLADAIRKSAI